MGEVPEAKKEQVLKNLKLWLTNAERFGNDPVRTRVNTANQNYKNLFQNNPHTPNLFLALGYTKPAGYYEMADQELAKAGLALVIEEVGKL
jgi:hypothetical protein